MSLPVYYNEIDLYCAAWLKNLMDAGEIPAGDIDTRSIEDVKPDELRGYRQCHFFAGLGGWAYALKLAGWSDRPVWTGSCPCQPFSAAGKGLGFADQRHLWPAWFHLISQCRPPIIFGEQVARATEWLKLVCSDLEALDYAVAPKPIPANCSGADHGRKRIWIVADAIANRQYGTGISAEQWERVSVIAGGTDGFPWTSTPVPSNAKDFRDFLLLADGVPDDLASIAAYGNAIVPQAAAEFIASFIEAEQVLHSGIEVAA